MAASLAERAERRACTDGDAKSERNTAKLNEGTVLSRGRPKTRRNCTRFDLSAYVSCTRVATRRAQLRRTGQSNARLSPWPASFLIAVAGNLVMRR